MTLLVFHKLKFALLLSGGCLNVHVNLLGAAAKQSSAEHKQRHQNNDHKDRYNSDNAGAAATTSIVSHKGILLLNGY